jgi:hypothetical protein
MICPTAKAKYFCEEGWTAILQNSPSGKSPREPKRRRASNIAELTPRSRSRCVNDGRREKNHGQCHYKRHKRRTPALNPTANLPSHPARCDGRLWRLRWSERKPETLSEGALAPGFSRPARRGSSRLCRCSSAAMETAMALSCGRSSLRSKVQWPCEHPREATAQARGRQRRRDDVSDGPIPTIPDQYVLAEPGSEAWLRVRPVAPWHQYVWVK